MAEVNSMIEPTTLIKASLAMVTKLETPASKLTAIVRTSTTALNVFARVLKKASVTSASVLTPKRPWAACTNESYKFSSAGTNSFLIGSKNFTISSALKALTKSIVAATSS